MNKKMYNISFMFIFLLFSQVIPGGFEVSSEVKSEDLAPIVNYLRMYENCSNFIYSPVLFSYNHFTSFLRRAKNDVQEKIRIKKIKEKPEIGVLSFFSNQNMYDLSDIKISNAAFEKTSTKDLVRYISECYDFEKIQLFVNDYRLSVDTLKDIVLDFIYNFRYSEDGSTDQFFEKALYQYDNFCLNRNSISYSRLYEYNFGNRRNYREPTIDFIKKIEIFCNAMKVRNILFTEENARAEGLLFELIPYCILQSVLGVVNRYDEDTRLEIVKYMLEMCNIQVQRNILTREVFVNCSLLPAHKREDAETLLTSDSSNCLFNIFYQDENERKDLALLQGIVIQVANSHKKSARK